MEKSWSNLGNIPFFANHINEPATITLCYLLISSYMRSGDWPENLLKLQACTDNCSWTLSWERSITWHREGQNWTGKMSMKLKTQVRRAQERGVQAQLVSLTRNLIKWHGVIISGCCVSSGRSYQTWHVFFQQAWENVFFEGNYINSTPKKM